MERSLWRTIRLGKLGTEWRRGHKREHSQGGAGDAEEERERQEETGEE